MVHLQAIARDITERKKAEAALRESEACFREMAETIREVFWMSTPDISRMLYLSPAFETIWGRPCQSVFEDPLEWVDAIHADDRDRVLAALEGPARGKYNVEYRIVRPDGEVRWIHDHSYPVHDDAGQIMRMVGIASDITELKQVEEALRESEERYRSLVDNIDFAVTMIDRDFKIIMTNAVIGRWFNKPTCKFVGKTVSKNSRNAKQSVSTAPE